MCQRNRSLDFYERVKLCDRPDGDHNRGFCTGQSKAPLTGTIGVREPLESFPVSNARSEGVEDTLL